MTRGCTSWLKVAVVVGHLCGSVITSGQSDSLNTDFYFKGQYSSLDGIHLYRTISDTVLVKMSPLHRYYLQAAHPLLIAFSEIDHTLDSTRLVLSDGSVPQIRTNGGSGPVIPVGNNLAYDKAYGLYYHPNVLPSWVYRKYPALRNRSDPNVRDWLSALARDTLKTWIRAGRSLRYCEFDTAGRLTQYIDSEQDWRVGAISYFNGTDVPYRTEWTNKSGTREVRVYSSVDSYPDSYEFWSYDTTVLGVNGKVLRGHKNGKWTYHAKDGSVERTEKYKEGVLKE